MSLLGLAGSSAAAVVHWLAPVMVAVSVILLGRAHYVLYRLKRGNRFATWTTWLTTVAIVGYWTWFLVTGTSLVPMWRG